MDHSRRTHRSTGELNSIETRSRRRKRKRPHTRAVIALRSRHLGKCTEVSPIITRQNPAHRNTALGSERQSPCSIRFFKLELQPRSAAIFRSSDRHRGVQVIVQQSSRIDAPRTRSDLRMQRSHTHFIRWSAISQHDTVRVETSLLTTAHAPVTNRTFVRRRCCSLSANWRGPSTSVSLQTSFFIASAGFTHGPPASLPPRRAEDGHLQPQPLPFDRGMMDCIQPVLRSEVDLLLHRLTTTRRNIDSWKPRCRSVSSTRNPW